MALRFLQIESDEDTRTLSALIGGPIHTETRGWAVVAPRPVSMPALCCFTGSRASAIVAQGPRQLALAPDADVADGARRMAARPAPLTLGARTFDWSRPVVMGIVNVTPDSFSDGGRYLDPVRAVAHGLKLASEGADILDVGGESTRPRGATYGAGAATISEAEEIERVVPVVRGLKRETDVPISIDTRKAGVAKASIEAGASLVNDVSGLLHDTGLADVVRETGAALALMHTPRDIEELQHEEPSEDILGEVLAGLEASLSKASQIGPERLLVDPGIGFGKTAAHNLYLLRNVASLGVLGHPILVGASRKASIARAAADQTSAPPPEERMGASVGAAVMACLRGAHLVRVHDVKETVQALRVAWAIRGASDAGARL